MMHVETPETVEIENLGSPDNPDMVDIEKIINLLDHVSTNSHKGEWASLATGSYSELHGLTDIIASYQFRWLIFKCLDASYCLYVMNDMPKKQALNTRSEDERAKTLSLDIGRILESNGWSVRKASPTSANWIRECSFILEEALSFGDNYDDVTEVMEWASGDTFWGTNVRSPAKLRKHYESLRQQAKPPPAKASANPAPSKSPNSGRGNAITTGLAKFKTEEDPF